MKKTSFIALWAVIFFVVSCGEKTEMGRYQIEKNTPANILTTELPMMNFWDNDNVQNIFTTAFFSSDATPNQIASIIIENNNKKISYITTFKNGVPKYTYSASIAGTVGNIVVEYEPVINGTSFKVSVYEVDWSRKIANVLVSSVISIEGGVYTHNLNKDIEGKSFQVESENTETAIAYDSAIKTCVDNYVVQGIEWIVSGGYLDQIVPCSLAQEQLTACSAVINMLREEQESGTFQELLDGDFSSLPMLLSEVNLQSLELDMSGFEYNYSVVADDYSYTVVPYNEVLWTTVNMRSSINKSGVEVENFFYQNNQDFEENHGRLYTWEVAQNICPNGWHLPSTTEWEELASLYGGESKAGKHLKLTGDSEFKATYSGSRNSIGQYELIGYEGFYWTTDEFSADKAYAKKIVYSSDSLKETVIPKDVACSVRCVKNTE